MDLSVVILSYNTRDLLEQALRTVVAAAVDLEVEVIVVDNASHDDSADMVAEKFPQVRLIRNPRNVGFAAGNNIAFRQASGRHVLLVNSDTIVRRDSLSCLVRFLDEHPEAGAAGCKILNPDGTLQPDCMRGFPTPMAAFFKVSGLSRFFSNSPRFARYNMTYLDPEQTHQVDALSGSCMMVRKQTMDQVGMLDEDYFMYGEDLDWCFRMHAAGWKIYYVPETEIIHFRGASGHHEPMRVLFRKNHAMSIFVKKNMRQRYRFFPMWFLHVGIVLHGLFSFLVHLGRKLAAPILDGALALLGMTLALALRYHPRLVPLMRLIEDLGGRIGVEAHPTRWLTPPPYTDFQWFIVYSGPVTVWLLSLYLLGLYDRRKLSVTWSAVAVAMGFTAIVTMVFFFKGYNFSRLATGVAWGFNTVLLAGWRAGARWLMHTHSGGALARRRILLVGADESATNFLEYLETLSELPCEVVGLVSQEREQQGRMVAGCQVIGVTDDLQQLVQEFAIDALIFTSGAAYHSLEKMGQRWGRKQLRIYLVPEAFERQIEGPSAPTWDELPVVEILPRRL